MYLLDIVNKYKRFSESLDVKTILCNKSWWVFNDTGEKEIYIFQEDGSLIISLNGKVTNANWKFISANKSLLINTDKQSVMVHSAFIDNVLFALQLDGTNQFSFLIDESNRESFKPKSLTDIQNYFENKELAEKKQKAIEYQKQRQIEAERRRQSEIEYQKQIENEKRQAFINKITSTPQYNELLEIESKRGSIETGGLCLISLVSFGLLLCLSFVLLMTSDSKIGLGLGFLFFLLSVFTPIPIHIFLPNIFSIRFEFVLKNRMEYITYSNVQPLNYCLQLLDQMINYDVLEISYWKRNFFRKKRKITYCINLK
jgi:hypothetical protein